jgi:predicted ATPase/signal transduction histidine kinase
MAESPEYVLEPLRAEADFTLYRGTELGSEMRIFAMAAAAEQPSPQNLRRLEHEYSLAAELDGEWSARPLALTCYQGRTVLILADPGGEPLDLVIEQDNGRPIDLTRFLLIAIGLAVALSQAHRRGLIHKDIKPANVLVDDSGHVWLTGFGIASRHPRERLVPAAPEIIAGTLAYMSPEQTGRMNRSIDSRSDLYSLGVTLYQLLTGALPFAAADALEWVHCHIARQPAIPSDRRGVPEPLSDIVMRLLAKNAEERYQTAAGLEADLRRCLAEWQSQARIDSFSLGADDSSDRLLIPEKLYGRKHEVAALIAAFDRVAAQGTFELVLISGYSGVGKSSLVNELHKELVLSRGLFVSGKFDQYKREVPYATLAQAFQLLVRQILVKSEADVERWRHALMEALGLNGQLIVNLVPELEFIIGKQPPMAELQPQEARGRFHLVLRRFLGAFARAEHPLALFLDDLQWLDTATLDLLEHLITDPDLRHLLLIGAYRDNEVNSSHPLMRMLAAIREAGAKAQEIVLKSLRLDVIERLVADALRCERTVSGPLAEHVHEKTGGNPFFAIQFLISLVEEGLVRFDRHAGDWIWDLGRIHAKGYSGNVADLMVGKLQRLPGATQNALKQFACLGNVADIATLTLICGQPEDEIHTALLAAVRSGLILGIEGSYAFLHDRIQEAAYALVIETERAGAHLRIGRLLLANTLPEWREARIFEIVGQFNRGMALVTSPEESAQVAELNLIAGRRAKRAAAYSSALTYFDDGRALLVKDSWTLQYRLTFDFELHRAECEFLTNELANAEERLLMLASRAANLVDHSAVTCLRVDLYIILVRPERAVAVGLEYLQQVGFEVSPNPTEAEVRQEYERIWQRLGTRRIEDLIDLPLMNDPSMCATIDVLNKLVVSALYLDRRLHQLLLAHMVNFSMQYGNSAASCVGYGSLGRVLAGELGDYAAALRFGQLSLQLVDNKGLDTFRARVYFTFGTGISPWAEHLRVGRAFLFRASEEAKQIGDLPYMGFCHSNIVGNLISAGEPLLETDRAAMEGLNFAQKTGSGIVIAYILGQLRLIRSLTGQACNFKAFDDEEFDVEKFERRLSADSNLAIAADIYWSRRLQALVFEGDFASALDVAARSHSFLTLPAPNIERAEYHFYAALARAGSVGTFDFAGAEHVEALRAHHRQLQIWAENCPENFESRAALVAAELARLEGRELEAERSYALAIRAARVNSFINNEALACETAARFYAARGFEDIAKMYLARARDGYKRWGANSKVRQLEARHPELAMTVASGGIRTLPLDQQLDVAAVVKASQVLSGEMLLPRLIERIMRIAVELAGAERGLLILIRDGEPWVEAEANIGLGEIEVAARRAAIMPSDLPRSVLHYAIRTHERVLLDDASSGNVYSGDDYVRTKRSRSVLCLPIVKQAKLIGALYLENNLTPGAFTPDRVNLLELLASQAAISLENAALYTDLQRSEAFMAQGQKISHNGSFGWSLASGEFLWSDELYSIFEYDPGTQASIDLAISRMHPDDKDRVRQLLETARKEGKDFDSEHRLLMPDGRIKHLHTTGRAVNIGNLNFMGAVRDVTDRARTEETLRQVQADLAHVARVATLNAMTASIAHEVNQPLSGILTNANTCVRMLAAEPPNLTGAAETARRTIRDANRAAEVIKRLRAMFSKETPTTERVDLNDAAQEVIALSVGELQRGRVLLQTEFSADIPLVSADRVQLQQVILNLLLNAVDSMAEVDNRPRKLLVQTQLLDDGSVKLAVRDSGTGVDPHTVEKLFAAFYTTKSSGMGVGLSICRLIIENHNGRIWAEPNEGPGATFSFYVPSLP